ncbi:hypothetical protein ACFCZ1_33730 [Streptomyces sp. NPDC056224]|uniref:hypothetical protein n=1 Tax=Streptomyces sp. NPDC056224 TaxID=3345750 RepID=UPI0035DC5D49
MIGEPELDGEWGPDAPPAGEAQPDASRGPARRPARPWLWALGGALLASLVWAGTLAGSQDRFSGAPRIAYRNAENLCKEAPLSAVSRAATKLSGDAPRHGEHPALDWSYCMYNTYPAEGSMRYGAEALVQLHKKTDPRAEFGAAPESLSYMWDAAAEVEQVPGLGERALISRSGVGHRLQVLDGGAVFTLKFDWYGEPDTPEPDDDAIKAAMIEDVRTLMAALKR